MDDNSPNKSSRTIRQTIKRLVKDGYIYNCDHLPGEDIYFITLPDGDEIELTGNEIRALIIGMELYVLKVRKRRYSLDPRFEPFKEHFLTVEVGELD